MASVGAGSVLVFIVLYIATCFAWDEFKTNAVFRARVCVFLVGIAFVIFLCVLEPVLIVVVAALVFVAAVGLALWGAWKFLTD